MQWMTLLPCTAAQESIPGLLCTKPSKGSNCIKLTTVEGGYSSVQLTILTRTLEGILQYLQEDQQDTIQTADIPVYTKTVYILQLHNLTHGFEMW